tara:strand:- start:11714 stop:15391 length:3678 start_codon:yes stop_codon:yes gene_type:complete
MSLEAEPIDEIIDIDLSSSPEEDDDEIIDIDLSSSPEEDDDEIIDIDLNAVRKQEENVQAQEELGQDELDIDPPEYVSRAGRDLPPQAIKERAQPRSLMAGMELKAEPDEERKISVAEWSADTNRMDMLRKHFEARYGKEGRQQENQTNTEYLERFLTTKRAMESNLINLGSELDWLRTASVEKRDNFVDLFIDVENNVPAFFEKGGGDTKSALIDFLWYNVTDPVVLLTGLVGKFFSKSAVEIVKKTLATQGRKAALEKAKSVGLVRGAKIGATVEGAGEATRSVGLQTLQQANLDSEDREIDPTTTAIAGVTGGIFGAVGYGSVQKAEFADLSERLAYQKKLRAEKASKIKEDSKQNTEQSDLIIENVERKQTGQGELFDVEQLSNTLVNPIDGKKLLDDLGNAENLNLLDVKVKNEVLARITNVAETIFKDYEVRGEINKLANDLGMSVDQFSKLKVNEMVRTITKTSTARELDPDLLDKALAKAGIDVESFEAMTAVSWSESGRAIGMLGPLGKRIEAWRNKKGADGKLINEDFAKSLDQLSNNPARTQYNSWLYEGIKRLDREGRALAVVQLGTTAANLASLMGTQTYQAAANAFETTLYHLGRSAKSIATGQASAKGVLNGFSNMTKDTFAPFLFLDNPQLAQEMTEYLLKHNPNIARTIDRSMSGFDTNSGLSKFSTLANHLNMVVDIYGRRAIFAASVDKKLRRTGVSFDEVVAREAELTTDVLKASARDAMQGTFASMPRSWKQGGGFLEGAGEGAVRLVEALPFVPGIGTGAFPYARFTVNAIAHQLAYSPAGFIPSTRGFMKGAKGTKNAVTMMVNKMLKKQGDEMLDATTPADRQYARDRLGKAIVGSGLLLASVKYAESMYKQGDGDLPPTVIKADDGRQYDMQRFWPIGAHLALGKMIHKMIRNNDDGVSLSSGVDFIQFAKDYTGVRYRTGDYSGTSEAIVKLIVDGVSGGSTDKIANEKIADRVGNYLGEVTGRPLTGLGFLSDVLSFFDDQEAMQRDPAQVEGEGFFERVGDATLNRYTYRIPILKQSLPPKEQTTRADYRYRQDALMRAFFGTTTRERFNSIEKELEKHGMKAYTLTVNTGDKIAAGHVNKYLGPFVESELGRLVESGVYKKLSRPQQENEIRKRLNGLNQVAKSLGQVAAREIQGGSGPTPFSRGEWMKTGRRSRALADDIYKTMYGKPVLEQQRIEPDVDHLATAAALGRSMISN